jgi:hypothetical protein
LLSKLQSQHIRNRRLQRRLLSKLRHRHIRNSGHLRLNQTIEKLQADLAISINKIAELEKAKSNAERPLKQAEQAKLDAENAKQEVEQTRIAEKMISDALVAQLRADKAAAGAKTSRWEIALYGSVGGLLVVLATSTIGFFINRRKASVSKQPVGEPRTKPIDASAQCQNSRAEPEPPTLSAGIAISEAAFERDLEDEVATINAAQVFRGRLGESEYRASERSLADFIAARVNTKVHLNQTIWAASG